MDKDAFDMPANDAETLQQRNRELSILNSIARALNSTADLSQALQATLRETTAMFGLHSAWIWLVREDGSGPYLAAALDLPPVLVREPQHLQGSCYCLDKLCDGNWDSATNIDVITCTRLKRLVAGTDGLRYHASVPLYAHGKRLGVMNVASVDWRELSPNDLRLLYTIGDLLSIAIERTRLFAQSAQIGALEERNRLAREIHDTLAQSLTGIALQLESADAMLESGIKLERVRQIVGRALNLTRSSLEDVRRSVLDLRAAPLEGRDLAQALLGLIEEKRAQHVVEISFEQVGASLALPLRLEVCLYRIAQEALNNALWHSAASQIKLQLVLSPDKVRLLVEDNGKGFELSEVQSGHYGLVGMRERARLLGGSLTIASSPNVGVQIEAQLPLSEHLAAI
jgi:two-component system NarL family sensor kinase